MGRRGTKIFTLEGAVVGDEKVNKPQREEKKTAGQLSKGH